MNLIQLLRMLLSIVSVVTLQIMIFNHLSVFNLVVPFLFLIAILMIPTDLPVFVQYLIVFGVGLTVDFLSQNYRMGLHAFSCLFAFGFRNNVVVLLSPAAGRDIEELSLFNRDYFWYAGYILILLFLHHLVYYLLESVPIVNIGLLLAKIFVGTVYSFIFCYLFCLAFYKR